MLYIKFKPAEFPIVVATILGTSDGRVDTEPGCI